MGAGNGAITDNLVTEPHGNRIWGTRQHPERMAQISNKPEFDRGTTTTGATKYVSKDAQEEIANAREVLRKCHSAEAPGFYGNPTTVSQPASRPSLTFADLIELVG